MRGINARRRVIWSHCNTQLEQSGLVRLKATFHYSSQLQTWLQTRFSTGFAVRFSTSSCGFATCVRHASDTLSTFFVESLVANLLHRSRHVTHVRSSLGFKQVCSWLSTCFRHAFDLLATCFRRAHASRKPGLQPGLQLARIMECGLCCFSRTS